MVCTRDPCYRYRTHVIYYRFVTSVVNVRSTLLGTAFLLVLVHWISHHLLIYISYVVIHPLMAYTYTCSFVFLDFFFQSFNGELVRFYIANSRIMEFRLCTYGSIRRCRVVDAVSYLRVSLIFLWCMYRVFCVVNLMLVVYVYGFFSDIVVIMCLATSVCYTESVIICTSLYYVLQRMFSKLIPVYVFMYALWLVYEYST